MKAKEMIKGILGEVRAVASAYALAALGLGFAMPVLAAEPVKYVVPTYKGTDGNPTNGIAYWTTNSVPSGYTIVESASSAVTWGTAGATSWYVVTNGTFQIDGGVVCTGDVNLVLCDGAKLTVTNVADFCAGIATDASGSFAIYSQHATVDAEVVPSQLGELVVFGGANGAGIGGDDKGAGQNITVNGGKVTAEGGYEAAGIGGGYNGSGKSITINGGVVTATPRILQDGPYFCQYGGGIGGGSQGDGASVTINNGAVTALGGVASPGIGGCNAFDIVVNGGRIVAGGGAGAAAIGSGLIGGDAISYAGCASNITISAAIVWASAVRYSDNVYAEDLGVGEDFCCPNVIGRGAFPFPGSYTEPVGVVIADTARVFFNLTGSSNSGNGLEDTPVAAMPADFEGCVIMTPETQTVDRVLVGGCGALGGQGLAALPWTVTNAVTGATSAIAVGGQIPQADEFLRLTDASGNLALKVTTEPLLTISRQPAAANGFEIVATTDGSEGITNYWWGSVAANPPMGFDAITNAVGDTSSYGIFEETGVASVNVEGDQLVALADVPGLPEGGVFHFTCAADLVDYAEKAYSSFGTVNTGVLRHGAGDEWTYVPASISVTMGGTEYPLEMMLAFTTSDNSPFAISNLTYEATEYDLVAEGATLTTFPPEKGEVGSNYLCRVTYGHNGTYYTADSEVFTFEDLTEPIVAKVDAIEHATWAVYTNGVLSAKVAGKDDEWHVWSNRAATVVYVAEDEYFFEGGVKAVTNALDTTKNPATVQGDLPKVLDPVAYRKPVYVGNVASNGIASWSDETVYNYTIVADASSATTWGTAGATSWYVVTNGTFQIWDSVTCQGHVNLVLCDGAKLSAWSGILTDPDGSFTVYGSHDSADMGELEVRANSYFGQAAIGGKKNVAGTSITINGGRVTAESGNSSWGGGAAIGGGSGASASNVVINAGVVTATATQRAAAIGGGVSGSAVGVVINGGTVTATSMGTGSAVGGGEYGSADGIVINGGAVALCRSQSGSVTPGGNYYAGAFAGSGYSCENPGSGVRIAPAAKVLFSDAVDGDGELPPFDGFTVHTTDSSFGAMVLADGLEDGASALPDGMAFTFVSDEYDDSASAAVGDVVAFHGQTFSVLRDGGQLLLVPFVPVSAPDVANAAKQVFTNDAPVDAEEVLVPKGTSARVVYTAAEGYFFNGGATTLTVQIDTAWNPAVLASVPYAPLQPIAYYAPVYDLPDDPTGGIARWEEAVTNVFSVVQNCEEETTWGSAGETNWYVAAGGDFVLDGDVNCRGDVRLILVPGATLTVNGVLAVNEGALLTVYGQKDGAGELTANGVADYYSKGCFTVNGGRVSLNGYSYGILSSSSGDLTVAVNGGMVTAKGNTSAVGAYGSGSKLRVYVNKDLLTLADCNNPPSTAIENNGGDLTSALYHQYHVIIGASRAISARPADLGDNVTVAVYTNGFLSAETPEGSGTWPAWSVVPACVVYTAKDGYVFSGSAKAITNVLDTTREPAVNARPAAPIALPEYVAPVYAEGGKPASGVASWVTNDVPATFTLVESSAKATTWGADGETNWYVVSENVEIVGGVECLGDVRLVLLPGATLTVTNLLESDEEEAGIAVTPDVALTVYGTPDGAGALKAYGGDCAAGIGGGEWDPGANVTINAGAVLAVGGEGGAGIGGGARSAGAYLTVNGGAVTAIGGFGGAGVGGGSISGGSSMPALAGATGASLLSDDGDEIDLRDYRGSGVGITINGGTVTALAGLGAAAIGGGAISGGGDKLYAGSSSGDPYGIARDVAINGGTVFASAPVAMGYFDSGYFYSGSSSGETAQEMIPACIGGGYGAFAPSTNVTVSADARVFFNLTGVCECRQAGTAGMVGLLGYGSRATTENWIEPRMPMPAEFEGRFAIMTPETQTVDRVLVGGCGAAVGGGTPTLPWALTNAVTAATSNITVDAEAHTDFAFTFLHLLDVENDLTLVVEPPAVTIAQQPAAGNRFTIVAETDAHDGVVNYAWHMPRKVALDFETLVSTREGGTFSLEGNSLSSGEEWYGSDYVQMVSIYWLADDLPEGGVFRFTCSENVALQSDEMGVLTDNADGSWTFAPKGVVNDYDGNVYYGMTLVKTEGSGAFSIGGLSYAYDDYGEPVAEGATLTTFPAEKGEVGSNYLCRVTVRHYGATATADSDAFAFEDLAEPIVAQPAEVEHATAAVYTNGVLSAEVEDGKWAAWSNETATVVYVADGEYFFEGGVKVVTNALDTTKNPATAEAPKVLDPVAYVAPTYVDNVASNGIAYWTTNTVYNYTVVTGAAERVTWGEAGETSWYVVIDDDVQIDGGVDCAGRVHLVLCDGAKLTVTNCENSCAGIATDPDGSFTIYETAPSDAASSSRQIGILDVTGGGYAAGIGGNSDEDGKNVTINGGTVTATGGNNGAGIGGGSYGAGSNITINGGVVTVQGGAAAAGVGGGMEGRAQYVAINGGTVMVDALGDFADKNGTYYPELIGNGFACDMPASNVTIADTARVLFNLTGNQSDVGTFVEPVAEMPESFDGFVVMTPCTQTVDRVLVGGCGAAVGGGTPTLPWVLTLTNAVTGAMSNIAVNGAHVDFAKKYLLLTDADGNLTLKVDAPSFEITQQPTLGNLYTIAAETDGGEGIVNYCWRQRVAKEMDFHAVTNAFVEDGGLGSGCTVDGTSIKAEAGMQLTFSVNAMPDDAIFHFTGPSDIVDFSKYVQADIDFGELKNEGGELWSYRPKAVANDEGEFGYMFLLTKGKSGDQPFAISNLTCSGACITTVAEGKDLTTFPAEKGEVGSNYLCRVTYGHHGTYYTADSDVFEFHYPIVAQPTEIAHTTWTVYTNGVASAETAPGICSCWSNEAAVVVYEADPGYVFAGGKTVVTNVLDTLKNPATNVGEDPFPVCRDLVIASDFAANPCFTDVETDDAGVVVGFAFEGKNYLVGTNAFTSFADAWKNADFVPSATNLHVFGYQTITAEPPMKGDWTFDFVSYETSAGETNAATVSIATEDLDKDFSQTLVNVTNTLEKIVGDGFIVLSVTNGTPGAAEYKADLESLIGEENVVVLYTNFEPERKQEDNPEKPGEKVTSQTLAVDENSKVEEDGTIVLPGVDTDGRVTVEVAGTTTNDVVVAGKLVSREWDVVIVNASSNLLTVGAVDTGMNVLITNMWDESQIVTIDSVIAGKKIKIDNNGHLEATAHATDSIVIRNTSLHTLVGTYKAGGAIDVSGEYGSLSNVVIDATGDLTLAGTNVVSGPVTLKSDATIVNAPDSELHWSVAGDNHTTMIDYAWIAGVSKFGVLVDAAQSNGVVCGVYELATNAAVAAVGKAFALKCGRETFGEVVVGESEASAQISEVGETSYKLWLEDGTLKFEISQGGLFGIRFVARPSGVTIAVGGAVKDGQATVGETVVAQAPMATRYRNGAFDYEFVRWEIEGATDVALNETTNEYVWGVSTTKYTTVSFEMPSAAIEVVAVYRLVNEDAEAGSASETEKIRADKAIAEATAANAATLAEAAAGTSATNFAGRLAAPANFAAFDAWCASNKCNLARGLGKPAAVLKAALGLAAGFDAETLASAVSVTNFATVAGTNGLAWRVTVVVDTEKITAAGAAWNGAIDAGLFAAAFTVEGVEKLGAEEPAEGAAWTALPATVEKVDAAAGTAKPAATYLVQPAATGSTPSQYFIRARVD